jgi:hypothetical protein
MRSIAIKQEAEKLICQYGLAAYEKALEEARAARRRRNVRLERFLVKVAEKIERDTAAV